ncbi:hypothetical protein [Cedecea neteri]|uniref:Uncharacterized protein n=1 Tax=Cedecea neteri TaxID=158822 RepID=A0A291E5S4_9ENTR|nr:hypothetical protein [Cedecea neteri]ATF95401.1 hypothetical protein CO704_25265 [Cedecea neteri]
MDFVAIIPAHYASIRQSGKPPHDISGKPSRGSGNRTIVDVLVPVLALYREEVPLPDVADAARAGAENTPA